MEDKNLKELWDRFERSCVDEMEYQSNEVYLYLKKQNNEVVVKNMNSEQMVSNQVEKKKEENSSNQFEEGKVIRTPLAGTFYRSASPEESPFVTVGQKVQKGDVIGIVEAMKMFNEVQATEAGTIKDILVDNMELVEYNQVLMEID